MFFILYENTAYQTETTQYFKCVWNTVYKLTFVWKKNILYWKQLSVFYLYEIQWTSKLQYEIQHIKLKQYMYLLSTSDKTVTTYHLFTSAWNIVYQTVKKILLFIIKYYLFFTYNTVLAWKIFILQDLMLKQEITVLPPPFNLNHEKGTLPTVYIFFL